MRLIDADALKEWIDEYVSVFKKSDNKDIKGYIEHQPTIEPKRGEWIPCSKEGLALTELMRREGRKWYGYKCSNCNFIYKGNALLEFNFCPNCGADMREREGE